MKRIAITMGEPGGIGPEVAIRAAAHARGEVEPIVVGEREALDRAMLLVRPGFELVEIRAGDLPSSAEAVETVKAVYVEGGSGGFTPGAPSAYGGRASVEAIRRGVGLVLSGEADALATAPISKEALRMAGYAWPGHTEMLAELTGATEFGMMLVGGPLRVFLATIHEPLRRVPGLITGDRVLRSIGLAARACLMLGLKGPRIAVAALNPHAGEGGMFGDEESAIIAPAVEQARAGGIGVSGPYPADTLFYRAARGEFDIVLCMYHDQGLIPIKLLAFETGVNVTVGLPIVRTSPDHGTAYDIAWQGKADPRSMIEAIRLAAQLTVVAVAAPFTVEDPPPGAPAL